VSRRMRRSDGLSGVAGDAALPNVVAIRAVRWSFSGFNFPADPSGTSVRIYRPDQPAQRTGERTNGSSRCPTPRRTPSVT